MRRLLGRELVLSQCRSQNHFESKGRNLIPLSTIWINGFLPLGVLLRFHQSLVRLPIQLPQMTIAGA